MIEMQINDSSCALVKQLNEWYEKEYKLDNERLSKSKENNEELNGSKRKRL